MTEPLTDSRRTSANETTARTTEPLDAADSVQYPDSDSEAAHESPPGTPRWVKAFGIVVIVLLLAFAGMHLTGKAPTHIGSSGMQHEVRHTP
jgi:sirohydrochlorin ferrochelatase